MGLGHLLKSLQFRYFSKDDQDVSCLDDALMGGIESGFSGSLFDCHNDDAPIVSNGAGLQTPSDQNGALLDRNLLHLESDVSALGRKFNEVYHRWLKHGMGHPEPADQVG